MCTSRDKSEKHEQKSQFPFASENWMRENENEYYMQPEVMKGRVEIEMAFEIETNITKKSKSLDFPCIFDFFSLLIIILIEINVNIHNDLMFIRLIQFYGNNQHENNI